MAEFGRLPVEVRPDRHRDPAGTRPAQVARDGGLFQAAPLPSRQPDSQHPYRQGGAHRSGARVYGVGEGGGRPPVPRCGRWPRRRLRWLADQLRVEHELHARRVRQRRHLPRAVGLRRGGRGAPHDRLGERTRGGGLPLRAGLQRAGRLELRRHEERAHDGARRVRAAHLRPHRDVQHGDRAQRARGVSRLAAGARHGAEPLQHGLPAAAAALHGREPVLGDLREAASHRQDARRGARRPAGARRGPVRHLLLQLLALPVDSRQLGDQAAVPGDADSPPWREARDSGGPRRHHL